MKLYENKGIKEAFGQNAKWLEILDLKSIIFMSDSNKMNSYDERHLGQFISSGKYLEILKYFSKFFKGKRILFQVEYSILKLNIIRLSKSGEIEILKSFTAGLFYGRTSDEIIANTERAIRNTIAAKSFVKSDVVKSFFRIISKDDIGNSHFELYEEITGNVLTGRDKYIISKHL